MSAYEQPKATLTDTPSVTVEFTAPVAWHVHSWHEHRCSACVQVSMWFFVWSERNNLEFNITYCMEQYAMLNN